ncbi:hypothetical protein [Alsobacter sp. R-9]
MIMGIGRTLAACVFAVTLLGSAAAQDRDQQLYIFCNGYLDRDASKVQTSIPSLAYALSGLASKGGAKSDPAGRAEVHQMFKTGLAAMLKDGNKVGAVSMICGMWHATFVTTDVAWQGIRELMQ